MGTIASVLQWNCTSCNLINPTECLKCLRCGNIRKILETDSSGCNQDKTSKCDSYNNINRNTLPGYVEIDTNG